MNTLPPPALAIHFAITPSSLGSLLVAATEKGLCAVLLGDAPDPLITDLRNRFPGATLLPAPPAFSQWVEKTLALIEEPRRGLDLPLDLRGTLFQQRVWDALRHIPPGHTRTYAQLAQQLGTPTAARAVASACAQNPLAVAIPCHRVIRADGQISGYRWGVERKRTLLAREAND